MKDGIEGLNGSLRSGKSDRPTSAWLARILFLAGLALLPASGRAQVVINEFLASNGFSGTDEEGDSEDWVELHNIGATEVRLKDHALTDDPVLPLKWLFPDVAIPPGSYLRVWLSGKDRFVPPPEVIAGDAGVYAFEPDIIEREAEWQYLVADPAGTGPPAGWNAIVFDAAGFSTGRAGFGYGDEDDYTDLPPGTTAVFIRKTFTIEDAAQLKTLVLEVDFDDGFVAYLNGKRTVSANFGQGNPTFASAATAGREAGSPQRYDMAPFRSDLVNGTNVLAVVGLNTNSNSSDLSLHPALGTIPLVLHASFKLENQGEYLGLSDPSGRVLDEVIFPRQTEDHSYGRSPNGTGPWLYYLTPSPEASNDGITFPEPFSSSVSFDPPAGKFPAGSLDVTIAVEPAALSEIRYTTDGSVPDNSSSSYTGPIRISTNTVFRAAGFISGERSTRVASQSYFLGGTLALPIISISMEPEDYAIVHNSAGASGRLSERAGYLEIFESDGAPGPATGFGLRLHGGAGRGGDFNTKKAYKCYFRSSYGVPKLNYPLIPETPVTKFDKLVLRSGFNDAFRTNGNAAYIRDQLIRDLQLQMGGLTAHGSWCNLYVNMRYRGVYNVVERMDEEFLQDYSGEREWDVMKTGNDVLYGENTEWERLHSFIVPNDLSQDAVYEQAAAMVDLENFTGYMILNTWAQNHDWPHNNWYAARRRTPEGRWTFLSWDAEFGIGLIPGGYTADSLTFALGQGGYLRDCLQGLLENAGYRDYFAAEVDRHIFFSLKPANVLAHIERLRAVIAPDMPEEAQITGNTFVQWQNNINTTRTFAGNRSAFYRNAVLANAQLQFPSPPRIFVADPPRVVNVGSTVVRLRGVRWKSDTVLRINGVAPAAIKLIPNSAESIVEATLPLTLAVAGRPVLTAEDPASGQTSEARDLLEILPPVPEMMSIEPAVGGARGGEKIRISGFYFLPDAQVLFGGAPATGVTRTAGTPEILEAVVPAGPAGPVDVVVINKLGADELRAATPLTYTYISPGPKFRRGDENGDGTIDLTDAVGIIFYLYLGGEESRCLKADDANDSGDVDLSDAVFVLAFLFTGGPEPPAPHPDCGADATEDSMDCAETSSCP